MPLTCKTRESAPFVWPQYTFIFFNSWNHIPFATKKVSWKENSMKIQTISLVTHNFFTTLVTTLEVTYYDWYTIKVISMVEPCKSNVAPLTTWELTISMFLENVVSLALLKNKNDFGCTMIPTFFLLFHFFWVHSLQQWWKKLPLELQLLYLINNKYDNLEWSILPIIRKRLKW